MWPSESAQRNGRTLRIPWLRAACRGLWFGLAAQAGVNGFLCRRELLLFIGLAAAVASGVDMIRSSLSEFIGLAAAVASGVDMIRSSLSEYCSIIHCD